MKRTFGVQLYTVRNQAEKDLPGVLRAIQALGYEEVEPYWNIYNHRAAELKKMFADNGLRAPSGHFDYAGLDTKFDYAQELGLGYMVCPMLPKSMWNSLDGYKQAADQFNRWAEQTNKRGMRFGFHNHNYEFRKFGDTTGFDTLLARTDPKLVFFEMDCYWIAQAGLDPVKMLKEHGSRIKLLHVKDRKAGFPTSTELNKPAEHFAEVGTGEIDWKAVFATASASGVEHYFVEQDECERPPLESLQISYNNLQKLLA